MKIVPIIPALNPDVKIIKSIDELISNGFSKIIVVNDGSSSLEIFDELTKKKECIILTHEINKGKGCALKTAFKYYKDNLSDKYEGVITLDADGQHSIRDVINISNVLVDNKLFTLGTRLFNTKETPLRNKMGNRITSFVFEKLYGVYLKDTQTGLRAIPNHLIDLHISTQGERFEYEINALIDLVKTYEKILQIDIQTVYLEDSNKKSHFNPFKDSYKIYKILFKRRKK